MIFIIKKIKLSLETGTYTVIRDAGSIILTRRKTPAMSEFMRQHTPPVKDGQYLIYQHSIRKEQTE